MNIFNRNKSFAGMLILFPLSVLAVSAVSPTTASQSTDADAKTHTLFMGTDVVVERDKKLCRVSDVVGSTFIVAIDGKRTVIPMGGGSHGLKLEQTLKLSSASASLTGLTGERTYTPGNDPRMRRQKEQMAVNTALEDVAQASIVTVVKNQDQLAYLETVKNPDHPSWKAAVAQAQSWRDTAAKANEKQTLEMASDLTSGAAIRSRAEGDMASENFDAVEISFEVASETPLTNPYLVAITRFLPRNVKPGILANNAIYAKELPPIGSKPQTISFTQGGFPLGYTLEGFEVHLYDHGVEIATNVAPNRVTLTREEAFLYLKIEYLNKHKGDTLPPSLAMKKIYPAGKPATSAGPTSEFYYVKVSKEGLPVATFKDEACSQRADAATESMAANFRFFPAMEKGKQVDGVARVLVTQPET